MKAFRKTINLSFPISISHLTKYRTIYKGATGTLVALLLFSTLAEGYQSKNNCKKPSLLHYKSFRTERKMKPVKIPAAYVPHGGGPLPILGDEKHKDMVKWLEKFADNYLVGEKKPKACLVISAHWEERQPTLQSGETTDLYYDYYGFPKESYNLKYRLPGATDLAKRAGQLLDDAKIPYQINHNRGYDHGVFIPMMILFPDGNIPTIQISLVKGLDPLMHIKLGEALAPLRSEGVFILGSGMSYHNMRGFNNPRSNEDSDPFHEYLRNSLLKSTSFDNRKNALEKWSKAPKARDCHPREEHLIPLFVVLGATKDDADVKVTEEFYANVAGVKCAGYVFE